MNVIEIAGGWSAGYAGMLFTSMGSAVTRLEPIGDATFANDLTAEINEPAGVYLHRNKKRLALDLDSKAGRETFFKRVARADAIVEDLGPGGLKKLGIPFKALKKANKNIIVASISPFGKDGPRAEWEASELVVQAMGGVVHSTGWEEVPPFRTVGNPAHSIAGIQAATAIIAARFGIAAGTNRAAHIDVSMQECYIHHWTRHIGEWSHNGTRTIREQRDYGRQGFRHTAMTKDGWLYLLALNAEWEPVAWFLGLEQFISGEWADAKVRQERWAEIEPHYQASLAKKSRYEWVAEAAEMGYTFAPVESAFDLVANPQYEARGYFREASIGNQVYKIPGLPFDPGDRAPVATGKKTKSAKS